MIGYCVYRHTFPNNKIYIGITAQKPERRWANGFGYKNQPYIFNAIAKFGWDNIKHEILCTGLSKDDAEQMEVDLIAQYKSNQKRWGYNIANGGSVTGMVSNETKRKISESLKGKPKMIPPWLGKHHSLESKKKMSEQRKGEGNPMYGKRLSEETKAKMSESHKRGKLCKAVICLETGRVYVSASECARAMHLSQGNVSAVARGERKDTKGYHFKFAEEVTLTDGIHTGIA